MKFVVRLREAHLASGLSKYRVARDNKVSDNTISKYVDEDFVSFGQLPTQVIKLCEYYGVDWRDPQIVQIIEDGSEDELSGQLREAVLG